MPWPATEVYPVVIDGQSVGHRGHAVFTPFANALGLPAISLPARPSAKGLPIGVQLAAAQGHDANLLAFARSCERATLRGGLAPELI
jgi:aspartyl-tRNA(Asn)/glutamyl-tRNA(Gln) amidotransferase subunit A